MPRSSRPAALHGLAVVALTVGLLASGAVVRAETRVGVKADQPTDRGTFAGTWVFVDRDRKMAVWMRDGEQGRPELKLRYQSTASPETFETDWTGVADYYFSGQPGKFALRIVDGDADRLQATWDWNFRANRSGRDETGRLTIYRGFDGRKLVLWFDEFSSTIVSGDRVRKTPSRPFALTFVKASKRLVLWEELPF